MKHQRLKEYIKKLVKKMLEEDNVTGGGTGGASFTAGNGENYATPFAFDKNKSADGASKKVYGMLGYKKVKQPKSELYDIEKWK